MPLPVPYAPEAGPEAGPGRDGKIRTAAIRLLVALMLTGLLATTGCGGGSEAGGGEAGVRAANGSEGGNTADPLQDGFAPSEAAASASFEAAQPTAADAGVDAGSDASASPATEAASGVPDASGDWSGTVQSGAGEEGRLQLSLGQEPDGMLAGSMVWTVNGQEPVPFEGLTGLVHPDGQVELLWRHPLGEDQGRVELVGTLSAGGAEETSAPATAPASAPAAEDQFSGEATASPAGASDGAVTFVLTRSPE